MGANCRGIVKFGRDRGSIRLGIHADSREKTWGEEHSGIPVTGLHTVTQLRITRKNCLRSSAIFNEILIAGYAEVTCLHQRAGADEKMTLDRRGSFCR